MNFEGVRKGKKKQGVKRNSQEHEAVVRVQKEKMQSGRKKDKRFEGVVDPRDCSKNRMTLFELAGQL